jgi:hypothetical protein
MSTATEPQAPAAGTVTPDTFRKDAATVAPKDLNSLLAFDPRAKVADAKGALVPAAATPPAAAPAAAAPVPGATPPAATPPAATPPAADPGAAPAAEGEEFRLAKNWRLEARNTQEAQFFLLLRQGKTPQEATKEIYGTATPPAAVSTAAPSTPALEAVPEAPPTKEIDDRISVLTGEVTTLSTQIEQAIEKDADPKTALRLQSQQFDKKLELDRLQQRREGIISETEAAKVEARVSQFQQARSQSQRRVQEAYAPLSTDTSPERALFNQKVESMRNDPAQAPIFHSPNWPEVVASMLAVEHGWVRTAPGATRTPAAAAAPAAAATPQSAASARATSAEVITPSDASPGSSFVPTEADLRTAAASAKPEDLNKLLAGPTPKPGRR